MGVPSLWVWQLLFWLLGVVLVWWVAYSAGFGRTYASDLKPVRLGMPDAIRSPDWIASGLNRVVNRREGEDAKAEPNARLLRPELETKQPHVQPDRGKVK
jgi:hypothetical protein